MTTSYEAQKRSIFLSAAWLQTAATLPHKSSCTAGDFAEGLTRVQPGYLSTDVCGGFSLFRFRPHAVPPSLDNLDLSASAEKSMLTPILDQTRLLHT